MNQKIFIIAIFKIKMREREREGGIGKEVFYAVSAVFQLLNCSNIY